MAVPELDLQPVMINQVAPAQHGTSKARRFQNSPRVVGELAVQWKPELPTTQGLDV